MSLPQRTLPPKEFYLAKDLAKFFGVSTVTIQRHAKEFKIGRMKVTSRGGRGIYIFLKRGNSEKPNSCDITRMAEILSTRKRSGK